MLPNATPPSTNPVTSDNVQAYYNWLYAQYYQGIQVPATQLNVETLFWEFFFLFALVTFFYLFARFFLSVHREGGELYGLTSFAGNILERNGKVSILDWVLWIFIMVWALSFIVKHIIFGQVY